MDLRLFIAVELPPAWTEALAATQRALRRYGLERLRWVRPEGIHLTLKFLGNVDEARVSALTRTLEETAAEHAPFALRLSRLGAFGPPARRRVVWAGVAGDLDALTRLRQTVERRAAALGFPAERRPFSPHLTLARVPEELPQPVGASIDAALTAVAAPAAPPLQVKEIALMHSRLLPGGAQYTRLAAAVLAKSPPDRGSTAGADVLS
jgi:2'-5' RNA ligase